MSEYKIYNSVGVANCVDLPILIYRYDFALHATVLEIFLQTSMNEHMKVLFLCCNLLLS